MAAAIDGYLDTVKALRKFTPDLYKEMNAEIRSALQEVVTDAKAKVPNAFDSGSGLRQWSEANKTFGQQNFPKWNGSLVRRNIQYSTRSSRPNKSGFVQMYALLNKSAAGAIAETAGTQNPNGQPWVGPSVDRAWANRKQSHSQNPNAGRQFIEGLNRNVGQLQRVGAVEKNKRGRIIYAAYAEQQGRTLDKIMVAIKKATSRYNSLTAQSYGLAA
jgi:hypothetical protein